MPSAKKSIRERVVSIGADGAVVAIATERAPGTGAGSAPAATLPTVIFLNAGVLHRVGPHRLHVTLARQLADCGFSSLRVDLSGIGDSRPLPGDLTFRESSVVDVRCAMDELSATQGVASFILFGLCSGADNALATAQRDERVVGLVLLDPPCQPTLRSRLRKLGGRIPGLSVSAAARLGARVLSRGLKRHSTAAQNPRQASAEEYGRTLFGLLARGVQVLCIYSGANAESYNHRDQLFEMFPRLRGQRIEVIYFPAANHEFTERVARERLLGTVMGWCREQFRGV